MQATHGCKSARKWAWCLVGLGITQPAFGPCCRNWAPLPWMLMVLFTMYSCVPALHHSKKQTCECSISHLQEEGLLQWSVWLLLLCYTESEDSPGLCIHSHDKAEAPPWNIFCLLLSWACAHYGLQKSPVLLCQAKFYLSLVNAWITSAFLSHIWRTLSQN